MGDGESRSHPFAGRMALRAPSCSCCPLQLCQTLPRHLRDGAVRECPERTPVVGRCSCMPVPSLEAHRAQRCPSRLPDAQPAVSCALTSLALPLPCADPSSAMLGSRLSALAKRPVGQQIRHAHLEFPPEIKKKGLQFIVEGTILGGVCAFAWRSWHQGKKDSVNSYYETSRAAVADE